jgi:hypothetical protein
MKVEQPATDAGLVGGHHDAKTGVTQPGDGFQTAGNRNPLIRGFDVSLGILVDYAVSVKDDQFHRIASSATSVQVKIR